jgi:hypothetical protein
MPAAAPVEHGAGANRRRDLLAIGATQPRSRRGKPAAGAGFPVRRPPATVLKVMNQQTSPGGLYDPNWFYIVNPTVDIAGGDLGTVEDAWDDAYCPRVRAKSISRWRQKGSS